MRGAAGPRGVPRGDDIRMEHTPGTKSMYISTKNSGDGVGGSFVVVLVKFWRHFVEGIPSLTTIMTTTGWWYMA